MTLASDAHLEKRRSAEMDTVVLTLPSHREFFITAVPQAQESAEGGAKAVLKRVTTLLRGYNAEPVALLGFGPSRPSAFGGLDSAFGGLDSAFGGLDWPVTWVQEKGGPATAFRGIQVWAVSGVDAVPVDVDGLRVGTVFEYEHARFCCLSGLQPAAAGPAEEPPLQAAAALNQMGAALHKAGMGFSHVLRTWFFLDDLLGWYDAFNRVRTAFFSEKRLLEGLVPASTGIGGSNPAGAALTAGLLAAVPKNDHVHVAAVPSPLQGTALAYGSSFSRAVELAMPGHRRLYVSGTASIDAEGRTLHEGDVDAQVNQTMCVVHAILESRGMDWADVVRAIVYFKHAGDRPRFAEFCAREALPPLPVLVVNNDVCRDDLLFEVEIDAIRVGS